MSKKNPYAPKTLESTNRAHRNQKKVVRKSVVDGTIKEIMTWVDGNPERAQRALDDESAKDSPRGTLVKNLTALLETSKEN